jgi:hypothetical protein
LGFVDLFSAEVVVVVLHRSGGGWRSLVLGGEFSMERGGIRILGFADLFSTEVVVFRQVWWWFNADPVVDGNLGVPVVVARGLGVAVVVLDDYSGESSVVVILVPYLFCFQTSACSSWRWRLRQM